MEIIDNIGTNNCTYVANGRNIKYIVVHYTAGRTSVKGTAYSLASSYKSKYGVASDYTIDRETVVRYNNNPEHYYTWHCGGKYGNEKYGGWSLKNIATNSNSIGIEVCSDYNGKYPNQANSIGWSFHEGCIKLLTQLVKKLMNDYNIDVDHVVRHFDTAGKICPGIVGWNTAPIYETKELNNDDKWQAFKRSLGGTSSSETNSSVSYERSGYYFHPLGDYAQFFIDNNRKDYPIQFPHSYHGHGWGKIDFGVGEGKGVYSMTNGTVVSVNARSKDDQKGFVVVIKSDRTDSTGKAVYINYLEMAGLSDKILSLIPTQSVSSGTNSYNNQNFSVTCNEAIKMGELIGYTNGWFNESSLHLDMTYMDRYNSSGQDSFTSPESVPHLTSLPSIFTQSATGDIQCNGYSLGSPTGHVYRYDLSETSYTVYPDLNYLVTLQKPIKIAGQNTGPTPSGSISIIGDEPIAYKDNMNQQAVEFYLTGTMSDNWTGTYPETIEQLNNDINCRGLRYAAAICSKELNFDTFSNVTYAKLMRAKMIGEANKKGNNMKEWFENLNPKQFAEKHIWTKMTFSNNGSDLIKAQLVYKNLKYPDIYGIEYFSGTEEFKNAIIYGCRQIPIYNQTDDKTGYPLYRPHAFLVNFNKKSNKDCGFSYAAGNFLMYRQVKADMLGFNNRIV